VAAKDARELIARERAQITSASSALNPIFSLRLTVSRESPFSPPPARLLQTGHADEVISSHAPKA